MLSFRNVSAYEARNNYWAGRILQAISGDSLYLKEPGEQPWGFDIECDASDGPHSVHFGNGKVWSFCAMSDRMREVEWPQFLQDYRAWASSGQGKMTVRIERIFSDSFHMDLVSDNACLLDVLIWHYLPAPVGGKCQRPKV